MISVFGVRSTLCYFIAHVAYYICCGLWKKINPQFVSEFLWVGHGEIYEILLTGVFLQRDHVEILWALCCNDCYTSRRVLNFFSLIFVLRINSVNITFVLHRFSNWVSFIPVHSNYSGQTQPRQNQSFESDRTISKHIEPAPNVESVCGHAANTNYFRVSIESHSSIFCYFFITMNSSHDEIHPCVWASTL